MKNVLDDWYELFMLVAVLALCTMYIIRASRENAIKYVDSSECKNGTVHVTVETDTEKKVIDTGMRCDVD